MMYKKHSLLVLCVLFTLLFSMVNYAKAQQLKDKAISGEKGKLEMMEKGKEVKANKAAGKLINDYHEYLDFFIDGTWVIQLAPGAQSEQMVSVGTHQFKACLAGNSQNCIQRSSKITGTGWEYRVYSAN